MPPAVPTAVPLTVPAAVTAARDQLDIRAQELGALAVHIEVRRPRVQLHPLDASMRFSGFRVWHPVVFMLLGALCTASSWDLALYCLAEVPVACCASQSASVHPLVEYVSV